MNPTEISYQALKAVFATSAFTIYYAAAGDDIIAAVIIPNGQPGLRCVISGADKTDFNNTIRPTAVEVIDVDDAYGLVPLSVVPPSP